MMFRHRTLPALATAAVAGLLLAACSSTPGEEDSTLTLDFAFWGNDVRADLYTEAFEAFEEENPDIRVNSTFLSWTEFWEKRQTEAAGGDLPDVMQFDYQYLRQYAENALLLDLEPFLGEEIDVDTLSPQAVGIGEVADGTYGLVTSTNAWAMYENRALLESLGVAPFAGGDWDDYSAWMREVTDASDGDVYGGTDWTRGMQNFELQLRAEGGALFTEDGSPGFDEERLADFWESGNELRDGTAVPQQHLEELLPVSGFGASVAASELTWDNFGAGYLAELGAEPGDLGLSAPPVTVAGAADLYLKPSMLHVIAANTEHPEAAAELVDFLVNSPRSGEIFGTNRGLPASGSALAAADLDPMSQQIVAYEESISDRLGDPPPAPLVGYGTIDQTFNQLGMELGFGTITVEEAVDRFFTEMEVILST